MKIEVDVLVIGGGGAAARAAIEAAKNSLKVAMAIKGKFPSGSTIHAMGIIAAVLRENDNPELYYRDILEGGYSINNKELTQILANESTTAYEDLAGFGTEFRANKRGKLHVAQPTGMSRSRAIFSINHNFMKGLISEVKKSKIQIYEHVMITDLLTQERYILGAVGFNYLTGEFLVFSAKAVILATGGLGQLYQLTSNPQEATGDGYAMGLRAGAELIDMEFTQAMTCVVWPPELQGLAPPFDGFVKFGAKFYNGLSQRYMEYYEPEKMENVTRDIACICGYKEIKAGHTTSHGGLILDISSIPWGIVKQTVPKIYHAYNKLGLNATEEGIEWAPGCHHEMGGLKINNKCETTIIGLYAAGEVAGGVHGANRLGGNSLTATQVFGKIAGKFAANFASKTQRIPLTQDIIEEKERKISSLYERIDGTNYEDILKKLKRIMSENVWIIKTERSLKNALDEIKKLREIGNDNLRLPNKTYQYLKLALETINMLEVGELLASASLKRTESRGAHYRDDYPNQDDKNWLKNIIFYKEKNTLKWYKK